MKGKKPKKSTPAKSQSEMTETEKLQDWRRQRAARGPLEKPTKGKKEAK